MTLGLGQYGQEMTSVRPNRQGVTSLPRISQSENQDRTEPWVSQPMKTSLLKSGPMPVFAEDRKDDTKAAENAQALAQLLRTRSYEEVRQRMYDDVPGSPWWAACKAELELRNGQQAAEASLGMSRVVEKMRGSVQHFEQLADTLYQTTNDIAALLRGTQEASRSLEIAVYVA